MRVPVELSFTAQHEWLRLDGDRATVGITAYAATTLGDIVFLELPHVGQLLLSGQVCGEIESTKSVSDLYSPADGTVTAVNDDAVADPALLNSDPFGRGWLFMMTVVGSPQLLDVHGYTALIAEGS